MNGVLVATVLRAAAPADAEAHPPDPVEQSSNEAWEGTNDVREVVVTGTRTAQARNDSPIATQVLDRTEIEDSGAENLGEILEEAPSVQLTRGIGGTGISMQGLDPAYTVVLVDGQRTTGRINNVLDVSRFPAEDIERVEVVTGPSSVLYGADALAGTVNLISRRTKRPNEAEVHAAYGSFNTLDLTGRVGLLRGKYRGSVTGGYHTTDGWDADLSDLSTTGPKRAQWNANTTHEIRRLGPLQLWARAGYLRRDSLAISETNTGAVIDQQNRTEAATLVVRPTLESGPARLTISGSYNLFKDQFVQDQRNATQLDQSQLTFDHLGQATVQYDHEIGSHQVTAGVDGQAEVLRTDRIDPSAVDRQRYALFLQDAWTPFRSPRVVIFPGVRLDYDTSFGLYPTPRLALMVRPGQRWTFRASYGRGYRAPSFREQFLLFANPSVGYTVRGNASLRPETSWSTSFSAEYRPWRWLNLSANVFDNRVRDTITFDTVDAADADTATLSQYVNIGEATTRGVETSGSVRIARVLTLEGSYMFVHSYDHSNRRALPGRARHRGTAGLRFHRRAWGTSARVRSSITGRRVFFSDTDGDDIQEAVPSAPFATLDTRVAQRIAGHFDVFAGVENILNAGNATDNPLTPRTYYGGITARY